ncbi:sulfotransferase family protein [Desulfosarcina widdelii]|nr:sulfotransferase [Desulfosarcina widdelii]
MNSTVQWSRRGGNIIFLISLPRSGSTMLQKIIGGHPDIATLPEPWIMLHLAYLLKSTGIITEYDAALAREATAGFLSHIGASDELLVEGIRAQASVLYERALAFHGKKIFLDKTPRYYNIIPELDRIFPKARFIILLRNPLAAMTSALSTWFDKDLEKFSQDENYTLDMLTGPEKLFVGIRLLGKKAVTLRYEELVAAPDSVLKRLFIKLGLAYPENRGKQLVHKLPSSRFGDQSISNERWEFRTCVAEKWREILDTPALKNFFKQYLQNIGPELIESLGYSYDDLIEAVCA